MSNSWDEMKRAKEDSYFEGENRKALERLNARKAEQSSSGPRRSPITGEPMEEATYLGVVIDRCPTSGGVWLDKGELESILEKSRGEAGESWVSKFTTFLSGK